MDVANLVSAMHSHLLGALHAGVRASTSPTLLQGWSSFGHGAATPWWVIGLHIAGVLVGVLFLLMIGRAVTRNRRYRVEEVLGDGALEAVHDAIREAERRTVGEIVPVVLQRSDRHPQAEAIAALLAVLIGSAVLVGDLPWDRPPLVLLCQLGLGALGFFAARWLPDFKRSFVTEDRATEMAFEQAFQEFYRLGLHRTEERTGVLIFVSLFERRVIVLGDEGIDSKIDAACWEGVDEAVLEGVRAGSLAAGLCAGVARVGEVLIEHFPWRDGDRNELPDRVEVRRE